MAKGATGLGWGGVIVATLLGVLVGVGGFTFHYAEGTSYLSSNPRACTNCHVMEPQYDSWLKASHHGVATCVDCHLPASGIGKYVAKAVNGFNHSKAFTFQDFHEPILITSRNAEILQENCLRCHGALLDHLGPGASSGAEAVGCVHCHATVGHGIPLGLGGRDRGVEEEVRR